MSHQPPGHGWAPEIPRAWLGSRNYLGTRSSISPSQAGGRQSARKDKEYRQKLDRTGVTVVQVDNEELQVLLTKGTRKGAPYPLGWKVCPPRTQAHEGSYRKCPLHAELVSCFQVAGSAANPRIFCGLRKFYKYQFMNE